MCPWPAGVAIAAGDRQHALHAGVDVPDETRRVDGEVLLGNHRHPGLVRGHAHLAPLLEADRAGARAPDRARHLEPAAHRRRQTVELARLHHAPIRGVGRGEQRPSFIVNPAVELPRRRRYGHGDDERHRGQQPDQESHARLRVQAMRPCRRLTFGGNG